MALTEVSSVTIVKFLILVSIVLYIKMASASRLFCVDPELLS